MEEPYVASPQQIGTAHDSEPFLLEGAVEQSDAGKK
jgi:hypothetical protein